MEQQRGTKAAQAAAAEAAALRYAREFPQRGQARAAHDLTRAGQAVSASGVRNIWLRHGLETAYKRLKAVARASGDPAALTERQRELLRRGDASRRLARKAQRTTAETEGAEAGDRREHIMLAAAQLFVEHGYAGTSMRQIAERAGMLPGSVYHHFPAKEDLFVAIQRESFHILMQNIRGAVRHGSNAWQRLELACAEHINDVAAGNPISQVTATGLFAIHEERLQRRLRSDRADYDRLFRQLIDDLDLPAGTDRSLFRLALLGALNWTHVWYKPGKKTPREIAEQIIAMLGAHRSQAPQAAERRKTCKPKSSKNSS